MILTDTDSHGTAVMDRPPAKPDYSLTGESASRAIERGLMEETVGRRR